VAAREVGTWRETVAVERAARRVVQRRVAVVDDRACTRARPHAHLGTSGPASGYERRRPEAKRALGLRTVGTAEIGAVTFVQRCDSSLRLNVHFHTLALDGVST
jgi:hypothetical protein